VYGVHVWRWWASEISLDSLLTKDLRDRHKPLCLIRARDVLSSKLKHGRGECFLTQIISFPEFHGYCMHKATSEYNRVHTLTGHTNDQAEHSNLPATRQDPLIFCHETRKEMTCQRNASCLESSASAACSTKHIPSPCLGWTRGPGEILPKPHIPPIQFNLPHKTATCCWAI
jgi:hypothetical protein